MIRCQWCQQGKCRDCPHFVSGGPLRRVLPRPVPIDLLASDGRSYPAEILVLSTIELGLRTDAPLSQNYTVHLFPGVDLEVAPVPTRGKDNCHVFDILAVRRGQDAGGHLNKGEYALLTGSTGALVRELVDQLPEHLRAVARGKLLAEVEKAEILNALRVGQVLKYEAGRFRRLAGQEDLDLPLEVATSVMRRALREHAHQREVVVGQDRVFDVHGIPLDFKSGGILALDITEVIERERQLHRREMEAFREAIRAVTGGRLLLVSPAEMETLATEGTVLAEGTVQEAKDIASARHALAPLVSPLVGRRLYALLLCLSEALTNSLKHAGQGDFKLKAQEKLLRLFVSDRGPGIRLTNLPRAALMPHYSTKNSLGSGFTLMLYYCDRLYLKTEASGTTIALEFDTEKNPAEIGVKQSC